MTQKEIRAEQAESLKAGIYPGEYFLTILHHDGRIISRKKYKTAEELTRAAQEAREEWEPYAHVKKTVEFLI